MALTGYSCKLDEDCSDLHECVENVCLHKFILPLTVNEILGCSFIFLFVGLGNASGIGGVFLIRPLLILVLNYSLYATQ